MYPQYTYCSIQKISERSPAKLLRYMLCFCDQMLKDHRNTSMKKYKNDVAKETLHKKSKQYYQPLYFIYQVPIIYRS